MQLADKVAIANVGGWQPQRGWSKVGAEDTSTLCEEGLLKMLVTEGLKDARVSSRKVDCKCKASLCVGKLRSRPEEQPSVPE